MSNKKGGKRLGEGNYGCTVSPAYKCKSNINKIKNASKLSNLKNTEEDPIIYEYIKKIPNFKKYFVIPYEKCIIDNKNIKLIDIKECQNINLLTNEQFTNSIMIKGDYDLFHTKNISLNTAIKYIKKLLEAISILVKHNIAHFDIKSLNILIKDNESYFIDFDDTFSPINWMEFRDFINSFAHMTTNYIWPPEIYLQFTKYKYMPQYIYNYLDNIKINDKGYKQFITKIMIYLLGNSFLDIYNKINKHKSKHLFKKLLKDMTENNPEKRPSIQECYKYINTNFQV